MRFCYWTIGKFSEHLCFDAVSALVCDAVAAAVAVAVAIGVAATNCFCCFAVAWIMAERPT